ncbi:MAG: hypothetical protein ACPG9E_00190 [Poseidonia sp.]
MSKNWSIIPRFDIVAHSMAYAGIPQQRREHMKVLKMMPWNA